MRLTFSPFAFTPFKRPFARAVLLVEGATEKFVFPAVSRLMGTDFDRYGISIIECGGKGNLITFSKVASAFDIPYVVVADDDIKSLDGVEDETKRQKIQRENENHQKKNDALIATVPSDLLFWMVPNIEAALGINENSDNKIKQALERIKSEEFRKSIPSEITAPINKIVAINAHR